MKEMYGYKEKDVIGLAQALRARGNASLSKVFATYGEMNGKAKGTVRNLYYALAKVSRTDKEFCDKYLDGKPLSVGKIVEFRECEEKALIKKILLAQWEGRSVRGSIMELTDGDAKKALRYQNKFRNAIKHKPELIDEIVKELRAEGKDVTVNKTEKVSDMISSAQFEKLKGEINGLVSRIALKTKKENEFLKERIAVLEKENLKLYNLLYGSATPENALKYFRRGGEQNILN